jgi:predicted phosphate transport protein (TIGR00153 family)
MKFSIFPKEEKFYDMFAKQADLALTITSQFKDLLDNFHQEDLTPYVDAIRATEDEGDQLCHDILVGLAKTFVTPIDREDIHLLANHMDDVLDYVQGAAVRLRLFRAKILHPGIVELSGILHECAKLVIEAVGRLPKFTDITDLRRKMRELEIQGDEVNRQSVAQLFADAKSVEDVLELMKWKEIIEGAENGVDKFEDVLDVLEGVVIKHG